MWEGKTVSVVLMTYRERDSIRAVILDFFATGVVDEVLVIDNNAEAGTIEQVAGTGALIFHEQRQGYGYATRRGLTEATGDLIVLAEPDGTFLPQDIFKWLPYADQCDVVFGTRTNSQLIWATANMGLFLRWGNWAVAKLVRLLYRTAHLSDVGCTYKLLTRELACHLEPSLEIGGSQLGPELMIKAIASGARYVEVPINYLPRVGTSAVTGSFRKALALGLEMIILIIRLRFRPELKRPHLPQLTLRSDASVPTGVGTTVQVIDLVELDGTAVGAETSAGDMPKVKIAGSAVEA